MKVSLTKAQEAAADRLVAAGLFSSKDEAVARSLDWLTEEVEKFEAIRAAILESEAQSARGESREITTEDIMRDVRKRLKEENAAATSA